MATSEFSAVDEEDEEDEEDEQDEQDEEDEGGWMNLYSSIPNAVPAAVVAMEADVFRVFRAFVSRTASELLDFFPALVRRYALMTARAVMGPFFSTVLMTYLARVILE